MAEERGDAIALLRAKLEQSQASAISRNKLICGVSGLQSDPLPTALLCQALVSSLKCLLAQLRQEENLQLKAHLRDVYNNQVGSALEPVSASHGSLS